MIDVISSHIAKFFQLIVANYAWEFIQSETEKYFEWIINTRTEHFTLTQNMSQQFALIEKKLFGPKRRRKETTKNS